ncbi:MAG: PAS domain-containing protein [Bradyrhizobium sp.]
MSDNHLDGVDWAALAALVDAIPQLAWIADAAGDINWYNQRWYDYTGTDFEQMQGWGWQKVHHPEHVDRVVAKIRLAFESGTPWEDTFPLRSKDGTYRWFLSRALPFRDASGRITRWYGTNTDITERKEIESALRQSEERLNLLASIGTHPVTAALRSKARY